MTFSVDAMTYLVYSSIKMEPSNLAQDKTSRGSIPISVKKWSWLLRVIYVSQVQGTQAIRLMLQLYKLSFDWRKLYGFSVFLSFLTGQVVLVPEFNIVAPTMSHENGTAEKVCNMSL